ncbi:response regulator [Flavobacterium rakeshii]|uniref:Response regulator n=1 Tax=Flavobacterium rakeshii TaxID=1038845 RepID=A0A6N8HFT8_9FLAO|nr:response regulator [Flavobacterium rakeshii]MUV04596.1 response regulator [Flavobacterium rakeshii]
MNSRGEIIIVDDDTDDLEILKEVYNTLPFENRLVVFNDGEDAYQYLKTPEAYPFLIISDINMPKMNGFELRDKVLSDAETSNRIIPFVFISTCANRTMMKTYCSNSFHGYFEKKSDFTEMTDMLDNIIRYWKNAVPAD